MNATTDNPIRILELRSVWGTGGGPDKTILLGAQQEDRSKFATTVCYIRDARDQVFSIDHKARALGLDYVEVIERHSFDWRAWSALRQIVRDCRIDIVHAHDHKTDALTWWLSRKERVIPLSTAHGFSGSSSRERIYYAIEKRLLARFPQVIAVSSPIRNELIRTGSVPERVTVVNNAIDHRHFVRDPLSTALAREALGLQPTDVAVGAVGRLESEKRFDLLIEAFASIQSTGRRLVLLIAGEGSLRQDLEALISGWDLDDRVRLLGLRSDIVQLHAALDCFVQSSEREGTPNAVLEAMAMETPLIATDVGGTNELVTHGVHGLLVPRHDVAAIAGALRELLADHQGALQRARRARERVESEFSFERRMRKVEAIYQELVAARNAEVKHSKSPS